MPSDAFQRLVSSTLTTSSNPYLVLLQHSLAYSQRQATSLETVDQEVYKRARVRTPSQNAVRDFAGVLWLLCVARELSKQTNTVALWIQTTNSVHPPPSSLQSSFVTIDLASNPMGWDDVCDENAAENSVSLSNLEQVACTIERAIALAQQEGGQTEEKSIQVPVVFESLTPVLMKHGLSRTMQFLRRLQTSATSIGPMVVPVLAESLTLSQHRTLEDMAQAVLWLSGGEMTLIRQGVRDRGNVLRETIPFRIDTSTSTDTKKVTTVRLVLEAEERDEETKVVLDVPPETLRQPEMKTSPSSSSGRKVMLKHEEEENKPLMDKEPVPQRPLIYMQDDDPEFDDLDEEDPDDDLDI